MEATEAKQAIRKRVQALCGNLSPDMRAADAHAVATRLLASSYLHSVKTVAVYAARDDEVDCDPLVQLLRERGVVTVYPRVTNAEQCVLGFFAVSHARELAPGMYGLLEPQPEALPVAPEQIDVVCVPGRAFSRVGQRVGRGAGYYDRWLRSYAGVRVGLAFDWQVFDEPMPCEAWDETMNILVTPSCLIDCASPDGVTI